MNEILDLVKKLSEFPTCDEAPSVGRDWPLAEIIYLCRDYARLVEGEYQERLEEQKKISNTLQAEEEEDR